MAIEQRTPSQVDWQARIEDRVAELERLGASRWGVLPTTGLEVAVASNSGASQSGISAVTDLTGMLVNWSAVAGRRYRVWWTATVQQLTSSGTCNIALTDGASSVISNPGISLSPGAFDTVTCFHELAGLAGAQQHKLRGSTGAGTLTILNGALNTSWLTVTDIGPG